MEARYWVEHRAAGAVVVLGWVAEGFPHHTTLEPFLTRLLADGPAGGELRFVDAATGEVVARRAVARPATRRSVWAPGRR